MGTIIAMEETELEPYIFLLVANPKLKNLTAEQIYSIAMEMCHQVKRAQSKKSLRTSTVNVSINIDTKPLEDINKAIEDVLKGINKAFPKTNCL